MKPDMQEQAIREVTSRIQKSLSQSIPGVDYNDLPDYIMISDYFTDDMSTEAEFEQATKECLLAIADAMEEEGFDGIPDYIREGAE